MGKGDHVKVRRFGFLYAHHGIDIGDGTVVHFAEGQPKQNSIIQRVRMRVFLRGGRCQKVHYERYLDPETTVHLALGALGRGGYSLIFNNCEHFATFCKTGHRWSTQVVRALTIAASLVGSTVLVASILEVSKRRGM